MPWEPIGTTRETKVSASMCRFVIDRSLEPRLMRTLQSIGCHGNDVFMHNDRNRNDKAAAAMAEDHQILFTHDRRFLSESRCLPNPCTGVVVLPAGSDDALLEALISALSAMLEGKEWREKPKIIVGHDGRITTTIRNRNTGVQEATQYKLRINGPTLVWVSGKRSPPQNSR